MPTSKPTSSVGRIQPQIDDQFFDDLVGEMLPGDMANFSGHRIPGPPPKVAKAPVTDSVADMHFELLSLKPTSKIPDPWTYLHERVCVGVKHNNAPWNRCISLLRGHRARTCVIERHYVCLDLRSEVAAFYAQLDNSISRAATRLHFFSRQIDDIFKLSGLQKKSYLGYVILRDPGAPLIGRTVIKTPKYINVCADVEEPVHFFGQRLSVSGVPFMQQDERYAVCAHVAIWTLLYTAYRKGLMARTLIGDVVGASSGQHVMHPSAPVGLTVQRVQEVVQALGMHMPVHDLPVAAVFPFGNLQLSDLRLSDSEVDEYQEFYDSYVGQLDLIPNAEDVRLRNNPSAFISNLWRLVSEARGLSAYCPEDKTKHAEEIDKLNNEYRMCRELLDNALHVYLSVHLRSGFPVYCQTVNHATILCGYASDNKDRHVYYFHDDQFGPYLAARSIVGASREGFMEQAYSLPSDSKSQLGKGISVKSPATPAVDRADHRRLADDWPDDVRGVVSIGMPGPERLLLSPAAAKRAVGSMIDNFWLLARSTSKSATARSGAQQAGTSDQRQYPWREPVWTSILMGIDYKAQRRRQTTDPVAIRAFSCAHLAEWVVVVEALDADGSSRWEFVFDGTSSNRNPILQLARIGGRLIYRNPLLAPKLESFETTIVDMPPVVTPPRVGKAGVV